VEQEHDVIGMFYYTQGWQQEGTAENTSGESSYGPGWLSRPGARLSKVSRNIGGVSARMHNDSNSLEDRAKKGHGSEGRHAGTGEGISARMWQIRMKTGSRMDAKAIAGAAQTHCGREFHPKTLIEMWLTCLDRVSATSEKGRGSEWAVRVGQRFPSRFGQSGAARELGLVQIVVEASAFRGCFPNT